MGTRLFVGNLPFDTTEETLRNAFAAVGQVDNVRIITDRNTGRSRGFGFVEMTDAAAAQAAIEKLNKSKLGNRDLTVNEAQPRETSGSGGGYGGGNRNRNGRY
ncbi:MAG: RNA-binding protein [Elusimicrobia bacterium]|nr:RNA-binding protein [Elusimicrobiota bacterium]